MSGAQALPSHRDLRNWERILHAGKAICRERRMHVSRISRAPAIKKQVQALAIMQKWKSVGRLASASTIGAPSFVSHHRSGLAWHLLRRRDPT
ncbi:hypothetical protein PQR62_06790 [Herbaspirillum lusitanum]|uniref:Uncharacterized protein n=1 Tax=Herbaspirillum lusitanum TaxID=213312 RepID=A0ABW9A507_9BURK